MDPLSFLSTKIAISPEKELFLYKIFDLTATPKRGNGRASRAFTGFRFQVLRFGLKFGSLNLKFQPVFRLWSVVCSQLVVFLP